MIRQTFAAVLAWATLSGAAAAQEAPALYTTSESQIDAGDHTLFSRLHAPAGRERFPIVVLVTGSGNESELDGAYTRTLARAFTAEGIGVLAYDKRGVGRSTGTYTGNDFRGLGADAAAVVRHASSLGQADGVGIWGISQAGWIIPYAARQAPDLRFAILVSPGGVNPHEQVAYFLRNQTLQWGLTPEEADAANRMHRAVALYYAGRGSYRSAQAAVDANRNARWFRGVVTHPYWDEMTPEGRILDPAQLRAALRERPGAFEIYASRSSFENYAQSYRALRRVPTLIIYGANDQVIPPVRSQAIFARALRGAPHEFRVFENAGHDITGEDSRLAPGYLDAMTSWASAQFAAAD